MTQKISEVLKAARELITDPKRWTQGWFARTIQDGQVGPEHKFAVCFCSLGALYKAEPGLWQLEEDGDGDGQETTSDAIEFLQKFCDGHHGMDIAMFNDNRTHKEVLELFDKAIEEAIKHE